MKELIEALRDEARTQIELNMATVCSNLLEKAADALESTLMREALEGAGVCAYDLDECTVTLALDNEDQVRKAVSTLPGKNRRALISVGGGVVVGEQGVTEQSSGADPALVASPSSPQAVSTKGFDPGAGEA